MLIDMPIGSLPDGARRDLRRSRARPSKARSASRTQQAAAGKPADLQALVSQAARPGRSKRSRARSEPATCCSPTFAGRRFQADLACAALPLLHPAQERQQDRRRPRTAPIAPPIISPSARCEFGRIVSRGRQIRRPGRTRAGRAGARAGRSRSPMRMSSRTWSAPPYMWLLVGSEAASDSACLARAARLI